MAKTREQFDQELAWARARLPKARERLRGVPGLIDVLVGIKETGGAATEIVVFQVYVEDKLPLDDIAPEYRIPAVIEDVPTDVIARRRIMAHDVLCGGMRVKQGFWGGTGTLGAVGFATAANTHASVNTPVFLTNHHVASRVGGAIGLGCMCDCWCCACCEVGRLVDAQLTEHVDGSIATLDAGVQFTHEIALVGAVRGTRRGTIGMQVVKFGDTSGLTRGTITQDNEPPFTRSDNARFVGQIRVAPVVASTSVSLPGDSGSVYVDAETRSIVGLNHAGHDVSDGGAGFANHIADVMALLHIDFPVMGTAGTIPLAAPPELPRRPKMLEALELYRRDLERTESGRRWIELLQRHAPEVRHLVNHDRETKVAWQRGQGPAFLAHFMKSAREPDHRVPREVYGVRVENLVVSMAAVLQRHGGPELARAVTDHHLEALDLARQSESAQAMLANARRMMGH